MSCSISVSSCIADIKRVISHLTQTSFVQQPPAKDLSKPESTDEEPAGWEQDAGWEWADITDEKPSDAWLNEDCCISLSPAKDILAVGYEDKVVFLERKWDSKSDTDCRVKYEVLWCGSLELEPGECVTSLLCLPLASQHRSSPGAVDWTCIIAGFTSGYMRIYMHNGTLLLSQLLHDDPVIQLKCETWKPLPTQGAGEKVEELAILYPNTLVLIDGFSLYQSLRACRNQIAKAHASGSQEIIQPPPLAYKKWQFKDQKIITDIALCGVITPSLFEQLQTASFLGGVSASIRHSPPAVIQFLTTGSEPFVGVYAVTEGGSPPLMSDVALAVASKLTSAVWSKISAAGGWLGWGNKEQAAPDQQDVNKPKVKPKVEKGTSLRIRYGLPDDRRHGVSIVPAPTGKVGAITDDFGRVKLIDLKTGIVKRIWKGYRDAQCGWIISEEEHGNAHAALGNDTTTQNHVSRKAMFLVIYAPKRGILEIWAMEQGPRVSAFNVGKGCRLLTSSHGILGLSHIMKQGQTTPVDFFQCLLLQADGILKEVSVPFHCILSDKHSKRVRDLHLLTQLSTVLDEVKLDKDIAVRSYAKLEKSILDIVVDIQIPHFHQQALQCILSTFGVPSSLLVKCVETVQELISKRNKGENGADDVEIETVVEFCAVQLQLLQCHMSIQNLHSEILASSDDQLPVEEKELCEILNISASEMTQLNSELQRYWDLMTSLGTTNSSPGTGVMQVTAFLSCFEAPNLSSGSQGAEVKCKNNPTRASTSQASQTRCVSLRTLSADTINRLARFLFPGLLNGTCPVDRLFLTLDSSGINPQELMNLSLELWLSPKPLSTKNINCISTLHSVISNICSMKGGFEVQSCDDDVNPWWKYVRCKLAESTNNDMAVSAACVCRSVAMAMSVAAKKIQSEEKRSAVQDLTAGDWVSISVEMECWNLLIYQLHDVLALKMFLVSLCKQNDHSKPRDKKHSRIEREIERQPQITVMSLLTFGKGAVTQIVAEWICKLHILPERLGTKRKRWKQQASDPSAPDEDRPENETIEEEEEEEEEPELEGISEMRKRFPCSLEQDNLWVHCAWEFSQRWLQDVKTIEYLGWSLRTIRCIHSSTLRKGILHLLWERVFKEKITATFDLMKKVGKAPKDRLCIKSVGLGYVILQQFLKAARDLLLLIECAEEVEEFPEFITEDFWRNTESDSMSIAEEAADQQTLNLDLVQHHVMLISVMWVIMGLAMKSVKPVDLFDAKGRSALMRDFSSSPPLSSGNIDSSVRDARSKFFHRAFSNLVSQIVYEASPEVTSLKSLSEVREWSSTLFELASEFDIDLDLLRRHLVYELYSAGQETLAKEELISVKDKPSAASKLLEIVGRRLTQTLIHTPGGGESVNMLSHFPTNICSWIKSQDSSKLLVPEVPLRHTVELLTFVVSRMPKTHSDYNLASELAEAVEFLL